MTIRHTLGKLLINGFVRIVPAGDQKVRLLLAPLIEREGITHIHVTGRHLTVHTRTAPDQPRTIT